MNAVSSNVEGLFVSGTLNLQTNFSTGVRIAVSTGFATSIATGPNSAKTQALNQKLPQSNVGVNKNTSSKKGSSIPILRPNLPGGIRIPTIGNNIRIR